MRTLVSIIAALVLPLGCNADPSTLEAPVNAAPPPAQKAVPTNVSGALTANTAASKIGFVGAKLTGSHSGFFTRFEGTASVRDNQIESAQFTIDLSSMQTDRDKLTGHLLSPDFFDAGAHPSATFKSTSVQAGANGAGTMTGTLDMHGIQQSISVPFQVKDRGADIQATANFSIDRQLWGISYPGKPDDLIKDAVQIDLDLVFPKAN